MNTLLSRAMAKATELTKSGNLHDATALIQAALRNRAAPPADPSPTDAVIEGDFVRLLPRTARPKATTNRRAGLAETLRKIASGGMPGADVPAQSPASMPTGAQFLTLCHVCAQGRREYRLYIPAKRPQTAMPLIVMLHGCTQSPEDFAAGTGMNPLAEEFGCLIAYPAQPSGANLQKCWNWFRPADQGRNHGEPALIASLTRDILRDCPADPTRVYIAGLSAGGAAAAIVAAAYPDIFSAVGVHSGLPVGAAGDVASAFSAMQNGAPGQPLRTPVPTIAFHGLADTTVHPGNGSAVIAQSLHHRPALTRVTRRHTFPNGRSYRRALHMDADGRTMAEHWQIDGAGHAWAGGHASGTYTDPKGPDASREMLRFFFQHAKD